MKKIKTILVFLFAAIFIMSCVKEDYDSWDCDPDPNPGPGTGEEDNPVIIVNFDWSLVYERRDVELVEVIITEEDDDNTTTEMYVDHSGTEVELQPDMYEFVGDDIHEHELITVQRCTLTLAQNADGTYIEPENFTGGSVESQIYDIEETQIVTIPMRNQTRILEIRVIIRGEGADYLSSLDATINGIAVSRHINDAFPPIDGSERPSAIITSFANYSLINNGENIYSDSKSLLGINGDSSQMLDFSIVYQDGRESTETIDVTRGMDGFHTINYHEAWVLEFIIYAGPSEIGATIEDWRYGSASTLVAQ